MFKRASSEFHSNLKPWRRSMTIAARKILFATLLPAITDLLFFMAATPSLKEGSRRLTRIRMRG